MIKLLKNYLKSFIYIFISIIIFTFIITLLEYFNILNGNALNIMELIMMVITFFVVSFFLAKNSSSKGYQKGLILSIIYVFISIIFAYLIFRFSIKVKDFIYFLIIIASSTLGGMIGINKSKT